MNKEVSTSVLEKLEAEEERHTITMQPKRSYAIGRCRILHKEKEAWEYF